MHQKNVPLKGLNTQDVIKLNQEYDLESNNNRVVVLNTQQSIQVS